MTHETPPAGTSQPPLPAQTGGEGQQTSPPFSSPNDRAADAWRCETNPDNTP